MKAPFFTVLIDTYNHGEFVEDAVSSVLAQDFPAEEREILVVDDGSTDDTEERLRKFGEKIRYLRKKNGGKVAALPIFLGKYRLHSANLFQVNVKRPSRSQIEARMATREALLRELRNWLQKYGQDISSRNIRAYLKQWVKGQESDGFVLRAPGRWKYFRHLLDFPRTYGEIMTPRHRAYSYLRALAALFLGYHHLYVLDDVRMKRKRL